MKKALIIIGAVFGGLILLAIVGSMLPSDEPQEVVIVTKTETPAAAIDTSVEEEAVALTSDEQRVYDYIAEMYPRVQKDFKKSCTFTDGEVTNNDAENLKAIATITECATSFIPYAEEWNNLDWGYGEVSNLEDAFDAYMKGVSRYYVNWLDGISGGNVEACSRRAVLAELKAEKWAPRVEDELDAISNTY